MIFLFGLFLRSTSLLIFLYLFFFIIVKIQICNLIIEIFIIVSPNKITNGEILFFALYTSIPKIVLVLSLSLSPPSSLSSPFLSSLFLSENPPPFSSLYLSFSLFSLLGKALAISNIHPLKFPQFPCPKLRCSICIYHQSRRNCKL